MHALGLYIYDDLIEEILFAHIVQAYDLLDNIAYREHSSFEEIELSMYENIVKKAIPSNDPFKINYIR